MSDLVLASTSPRRASLLAEAGIPFAPLDPGLSDQDEDELARRWRVAGLSPVEVARRLAGAKALAAARKAPAGAGRVLAADTVVCLDGKAFGKPRDRAHAKAMLEQLAGRAHEVATGVALLDLATGRLVTEVEVSRVTFAPHEPEALERFLASGAWSGKAGAYGVQDDAAAPLVTSVEGSRSNVVGLPLERVLRLLGRAAAAALVLACIVTTAGCPDRGKNDPLPLKFTSPTPTPGPETSAPTPPPSPSPSPEPTPRAPTPSASATPFVPDVEDGRPSSGLPEKTLVVGGRKVVAELALTNESRRLGLMHRDAMGDDHGMLFVFPEHAKDFRSFWMKNTRLPLSIAYLRDDGTIINIEDMEPRTTDSHRSKEPSRLGLEMNKGWFRLHGIGPGAKVEGFLELLSQAE